MKLYIAILLTIACGLVHSDDDLHVETTSGAVEGTQITSHDGKHVNAFLGIPYAEPPVGPLRFKAPQPAHHSDTPIIAKTKGKACVQLHLGKHEHGETEEVHENISEDCLFINVWTPSPKPENAPVLIFVHGGFAFASGSSCLDRYDGTEVVAVENVIVVSMNFRLNALGFLFLDNEEAPGNMGLMDQALAMKWVHDNIAKFGGNPEHVTAFGETNGASAVGLHMMIPSSRGLFHQAILLNGSPVSHYVTKGKSGGHKISKNFVDAIGCSSSTDDKDKIMSCLREKSVEDIVNAGSKRLGVNHEMITPVLDHHYITKHPRVMAQEGDFPEDMKMIVGWTHNRGMMLNVMLDTLKPNEDNNLSQKDMKNLIRNIFPGRHEYLYNIVHMHYTDFKHPQCSDSVRDEMIDFITDINVVCPSLKFADELTRSGNDVWMFDFTHHPSKSNYPEWAGVLDGEELDFAFGHVRKDNGYTEAEHTLSESMMGHLGHFVQNGKPNVREDKVVWPHYNLRHKPYINITTPSTVNYHVRADHCAFWQKSFESIIHASNVMSKRECQ